MDKNNSKVKGLVSRTLSVMLAFVMIATAVLTGAGGFREEAYAKAIGAKNQQACNECNAVNSGTAPTDYTDVLGNGSVYRGGTAKSGLQKTDNREAVSLDTEPDTFASPLPYGDTFVDVNKIRWTSSSTYIIDIPDGSPFQWVAMSAEGASLKDANGKSPETDPMGLEKNISLWKGQSLSSAIAYVGPLKGFHNNFTDAASENGTTNKIDADDYSVPYLYRVVYPEAVTLPTGVLGNLEIIVDHVDIETTFTVDEDHPRVLTAGDNSTYKYTEGIVTIQAGNNMAVSTAIIDGEGNYITQDLGIAKTEAEVRSQLTGKVSQPNIEASSQDKQPRGATGAHVDLEIKVTDADGNEVEGTISYAAKDLDLMSYQNVWGRKSSGDDRLEFAEGLEIVSGSQSYALVPVYNHADGTTLETGWVPVGPKDTPLSSPLNISGGGGSHADGTNFRSIGIVNFRDKDGKWDKALFNVSNRETDEQTMITFPNGVPWNENGQLTAPYTSMSPKWQVYAQLGLPGTATGEDVLNLLGDGSWATERADGETFDTGFAVLLSAKSSKLRWTGSISSQGTAITTLFDNTLFTYIEQTHGTGGGIYLESYKINDECKPVAKEGVVTMGKGATATVTAVPEEGYRIKEFQIGGAGLKNPKTYTIKALGLTPGGASVTQDGITFEMNADGTVDVTFTNIEDPRHIHVDFAADYYFYKIWKGGEEPTKLNMTAVPYAYIFTDVTLPVPTGVDTEGHAIYTDTYFSIDGTEYTAEDGTKYVLNANNTLETVAKDAGGNPLVTLPWVLRGNSFENDTTGEKYDVTVQFGVNFAMGEGSTEESVKKTFTVDDTTAFTDDGYVTVLDASNTISPGNIVWKIKYPAEGASSLRWPALPIETEPNAHNVNHVERNYWFVTEEAPGWSKESYDNSNAKAPGVVPTITGKYAGYYDNHVWAAASKKDYAEATQMIQVTNKTKNAFMSVFSKDATTTENTYGGEITNIPALVVKAEKTWEDFKNGFNTRQEIWLHIDAKIGSETKKDILPPQKLAPGTAEKETVTWGDKNVYDTHQDNVKIIHELADIPLKDEHDQRVTYTYESDGSYKASNGVTYWLNELVKVTSDGTVIKYTIRETLDLAGDESVEPSNDAAGLVGYTAAADEVNATELEEAKWVKIGDVAVLTYEGKLKNKLETVDFTITKIWEENSSNHTHTLAGDVAKLKDAFTLKESDKTVTDAPELNLQPSTATDYVAEPESGTLETKNGTDETEVVFTWHNIPKYMGDVESDKPHLAVYSVVESPLNGYNAPKYSSDGKALDEGTITNEVTPPEGTPKQTYGAKNTPQTADAKNMFDVTTETALDGSPNKIEKYDLIDPATGEPAGADGVKVEGGTYTIDKNGVITFMPDKDFVGDPPAVTVRGTDSNGLFAETTYTPHVVDNEKTVTRTITYEYYNGDPVLDSEGNPKTVVHTTTFVGSVNPDTGEVSWDGVKNPETGEKTPMDEPSSVFPQVDSGDIKGYTYDRENVPEVTVYPTDDDIFEKVIYSPLGVKATSDETYGLPNEPQTGTVSFEMETETYTDGTPNTITMKLIDPNTGKETDSKTVDAVDDKGNKVGTYTLSDDGTVTFTPSKDYVGNPKPAEVTGTDRFGTKAKTTYTPHIVDPTSRDTAKRTIHFTYLTEEGETVKEDVVQELTLTRHASKVDPKTGVVLEWGPWEKQTFPAVKNPDSDLKYDGVTNFGARTWSTDDIAGELDVTEPGDKGVVNIVYYKEPYTVVYHNGSHGKSDGKGDQKGEDYNNDVTGGNGVTPDKGYEFTGEYTYVIKDKDGNVIGEGSTSDPESLKVTGNIEFTPVYKKLPAYNINYDKNGGTGSMDDNNYVSDDPSMPYDENSFTRRGYHFTGFLAYITNPETGEETPITDKNGKPIVFTGSEDMSEYFKDMPDGTSIRMEAQWEPNKYTIKYDANGGKGKMSSQKFTGADSSATSKANEFTRDGYSFVGFKAMLPDGTYIKDENGNDLIFANPEDFIEYLHDFGDGAEITLIAQWVKSEYVEPEEPADPAEPKTPSDEKSPNVKTSDNTMIIAWVVLLAAVVIALAAFIIRRMRNN